MHRPALAGAQRWPAAWGARSRTLENRLSWHWAARSGPRGCSHGRSACGTRWCGRPQGRLIHGPWSGLRNNHPRGRLGCRRCRGCGRPGSHSRRWRLRGRRPLRRRSRCGRDMRNRCYWSCSSRPWRHRGCQSWRGLRSHRRCGNRKRWSRAWSRYHQLRRRRRRTRWLRSSSFRGRWRGCRRSFQGRLCSRRGSHGLGSLLLADDRL
jgi:hypothetical protein